MRECAHWLRGQRWDKCIGYNCGPDCNNDEDCYWYIPLSINDSDNTQLCSCKPNIFIHNDEDIFTQCKKVMDDVDNSLYEYETDGLIFTPAFLGVGSDKIGKAGPKNKTTWL